MNNVLLFIGAVLVVVLAALFAVPHFIDWNVYRSSFESQATKLIGRDVRVGGRVSMRLLPAPYVSFENVRVADPEGRFSEPPLRVEAFTLWLSIPPLLRGAVEASEVDLRRPEFLLRMREPAAGEAIAPGAALGVLPVSIALRSVSVREGTVRVITAAGSETLKLDAVTGEFSAPSLSGPFRFRGSLQHAGRDRDLRITTGRLEDNGSLSLDATVRVAEQASAYQLKGLVKDVARSPSFSGDMTVKPDGKRKSRQDGKDAKGGPDDALPFYEINSQLQLSSQAAQLDKLAIQFEQAGRPQMLNGTARMVFGTPGGTTTPVEPSLKVALDARWLDLDQISAVEDKSGPQAALGRLGALAQTWLPAGITAQVHVGIEQATLGGDTVHAVELSLDQGKDKFEITRLAAGVPGGAKISVSGLVTGARAKVGEATAFRGPVRIRGQNLGAFLGWISPGAAPRVEDGAGAFNLSGDLDLTKEAIGLERMRGEIAGTAYQGRARLVHGTRPSVTIAIESDRLDVRPLVSGGLKLADVGQIVLGGAPAQPPAPQKNKTTTGLADRFGTVNSDIQAKIGRLLLPDADLRDVAVDLERTEQGTQVKVLRFSTATGLKVQADAQLQSADGRQRGTMKTLIEAEQPAALTALLNFIDVPEAMVLQPRAGDVLPLRLAGILTLGARGAAGFELLLDGTAQQTRTAILARSDQEPAQWRSSVLDLTGTLENAKSARLLAQLLPGITPLSIGAAEKGRLSVRANGVARTGISAAVEFESKAVEAGFSGVIALPGDKSSMTGEIGLKAADVADGLKLAGLKSVRALQGRDLVVHSRLSAKGDEVQVAEAALRLGSASVEASGRIVRKNGRLDVDLAAKASEASLPAVLAIALGTSPGGAGRGNGATNANIWTEDAIDLAALGDVGGKIRLETATLALGQSLTLQRAVMEAEVSPASVVVKALTGEALGGKFSGTARAETTPTGVTFNGTAKLDGVDLEQIVAQPAAQPAGVGNLSGVVTFSGRGLTPRGIVATLAGQGTLQLKNARLARFGPEGLEAAVAQALRIAADDPEPTEVKLEADAFKLVIAAALDKSPLILGTRTIPFELADGTAHLKTVAIDLPRGHVKAASFVDLATFRVDSEWTIETSAKFQAAAKPPEQPADTAQGKKSAVPASTRIPGVGLVLAGPLSDIARLEPRLNDEALARELLVRRMELDLAALERARKKKEDAEALRLKLKEDADRQRRLDEEKAEIAKPPENAAATLPVPLPVPVAVPAPGGSASAPTGAAPTLATLPATTGSTSLPPAGAGAAVSPASAGPRDVQVAPLPAPTARPPQSDAPSRLPPPKTTRPASVFEPFRGQ